MEKESNTILSVLEYKALFDEYYKPIKNFIYYKVGDLGIAEDLAQDAFVKLWENRNSIKSIDFIACQASRAQAPDF